MYFSRTDLINISEFICSFFSSLCSLFTGFWLILCNLWVISFIKARFGIVPGLAAGDPGLLQMGEKGNPRRHRDFGRVCGMYVGVGPGAVIRLVMLPLRLIKAHGSAATSSSARPSDSLAVWHVDANKKPESKIDSNRSRAAGESFQVPNRLAFASRVAPVIEPMVQPLAGQKNE